MTLTFGSLFSGIGGFDLGFERAGMACQWQVEIDDYCNRVLAKHWPDVRRYKDAREVGKHNLKAVDVICGGFPCQDISHAGKQAGITDDTRSGLWSEYYRIICELRPRYVVVENVTALLVRGMGRVLGDLAEGGYDAEWQSLPAAAFSAPHIRDRLFILAHTNNARCYPVNFIEDGLQATPQLWESFRTTDRKAWLEDKCGLSGDANGVPSRVDRLRGLGNAVVPQVAEWLGARIVAADSRLRARTIGEAEGVT